MGLKGTSDVKGATTCLAEQWEFKVGDVFQTDKTCYISVSTETCVCLWQNGSGNSVGIGICIHVSEDLDLD